MFTRRALTFAAMFALPFAAACDPGTLVNGKTPILVNRAPFDPDGPGGNDPGPPFDPNQAPPVVIVEPNRGDPAEVTVEGCTLTYTNLTDTRHRVYLAFGPAQRPATMPVWLLPGEGMTFIAPGPTTATLVVDGMVHTDFTC